jgi:LuxR family transcriptional regulator, quorum-sensing system regulator BjaR1
MSQVRIETETFAFIEKMNAAVTIDEVQDLLSEELGRHGFTQYIMTDVPPPRQRLDDYTIVNGCTLDWYAHYTEMNLHLHDPIARQMRSAIDPFFWDEVIINGDDQEHRMFHDMSAFGLIEGFSVPICSPSGDKSCVAMGGEHVDRHPRVRLALQIVSIHAHARARALRTKLPRTAPKAAPQRRLTAREREVLKWVACGKTDWEIGEILTISKETSFAHVRNCCRKLDASTRPQAVAKAILLGEISVDAL